MSLALGGRPRCAASDDAGHGVASVIRGPKVSVLEFIYAFCEPMFFRNMCWHRRRWILIVVLEICVGRRGPVVHGNVISLMGKLGDVRVEVTNENPLKCDVLRLVGTPERMRPHERVIALAEGDDIPAALLGKAAKAGPRRRMLALRRPATARHGGALDDGTTPKKRTSSVDGTLKRAGARERRRSALSKN